MKKFLAMLLAAVMVLSMAACGTKNADNTTAAAKVPLTDDLISVIEKITTEQPVEFMPMSEPLDLADTSEEGMWKLKSFTGLDSADLIKEAAYFEPAMNAMAFSMVLVRTNDAADAKAVAEQMKAGVDQRKWICVEANEIQVVGYGDVVMLIMLDTNGGLTTQNFVDAFQKVCGAELDFAI